MPELETAPPPSPAAETAALSSRFDDALAKVKAEFPNGIDPEKLEQAVKPPPTTEKPPDAKPPTKGEVPDHLITGDKIEKPADDDISKIELPKGASPKSAEAFARLKVRIEELESKRKEWEAAPKVVDPTDWKAKLEAAESRAAELEARVERTDFEKSPRFQQQFTTKEQNALKDATGYLEGSDVNPNVIELAARATGAARIKILGEAGVSGELLSAIMPSLRAYDDVQREKTAALENWKGTAAQWQAEQEKQKTAAEAQTRAQEERVMADVGKKVAANFEVYQKVEGHDAWNAQVDDLQTEAKKFFSGDMPLEQIAEVAYYGLGAKHLHAMFHTLQGKYREVQTELAKLKSASPGGGNANGGTNGHADPTDTLPLAQGAAARFDRAMGR